MLEDDPLYEKAVKLWGKDTQLFMVFEEMSELQKAICKWMRNPNYSTVAHIVEELADCELMFKQLLVMIQRKNIDVDRMHEFKMHRLKKKIIDFENKDCRF